MLFLDANIFYSYFGRPKLGMTSEPIDPNALSRFLDSRTDKSLPTSVFIEIMTHFRESSKILKEFVNFIKDKGLKLYNNIPEYVIDTNEFTCITLMNEISLQQYAFQLLDKKIEIESKFTLLFFEITRDIYTHYKLMPIPDLSEDNKEAIMSYIGRNGYKDYGTILAEKIRSELSDGYDEHKEQNKLKDFYIQELNEACIISDILISGCVATINNEDDIISSLQNAYNDAITNGMDGKDGTMPHIVDTLATDTAFLNTAKATIASMFKKGGYTETQINYLQNVMFSAWFDRGQKLQKNDIFDMFCVGCLDYKNTTVPKCVLVDRSPYLITVDKRMKAFIGNLKPTNLALINSI